MTQEQQSQSAAPKATKPKAAAKPKAAKTAKPRLVRGSAGSAVARSSKGRPKISFIVKLNSGKTAESKPQKTSLRTKVIQYLEKRDTGRAPIETIEKHFERNMRGVIAKLQEKKWVQRLSAE